jgi:hypothetical protein
MGSSLREPSAVLSDCARPARELLAPLWMHAMLGLKSSFISSLSWLWARKRASSDCVSLDKELCVFERPTWGSHCKEPCARVLF